MEHIHDGKEEVGKRRGDVRERWEGKVEGEKGKEEWYLIHLQMVYIKSVKVWLMMVATSNKGEQTLKRYHQNT